MVMYATPVELAGYLQQDVDTYTATQVLTLASERFCKAADTRFESTSATYECVGGAGRKLSLPFRPLIAVQTVQINGLTVTDWTLIRGVLYRSAGFGGSTFPPPKVTVALTHGFTSAGDDVKLAVLEYASTAYVNPDGSISEQIDDYAVKFGPDVPLPQAVQDLADYYRGFLAA